MTDSPPPASPLPAASTDQEDDDYDLIAPPEPYDPADYRWVPVRRVPRRDGWTEEKQRRFIEVLADTGVVGHAAKAVGMTRETAYRLRRSVEGAAFARAWDAARDQAGALIEDIAFERAIEGVARHVYDGNGDVVATRHIYNDRLLAFLLSHLKPERYGKARADEARAAAPLARAEPATVAACLREMEPNLPAPAEELLDSETLADELLLANAADGKVPHFLMEKPVEKSAEQLKAESIAAQHERGAGANIRMNNGEKLSRAEYRDMCHYLDPSYRTELAQQRFT
jgi:hypothetical protein